MASVREYQGGISSGFLFSGNFHPALLCIFPILYLSYYIVNF